ncbi:aminopeptidase O-like [Saccoglossus kowalevskii]
MSTWQANISTPTEYIVLMSGDEEAVTKILDDGYTSYRYHVNVVSPSSTLTIAIGKWTGVSVVTEQQSSSVSGDLNSQSQAPQDCEHSDKWPCRVNRYDQPIIPCRIFAPKSLIQKTVNEFGPWLPKYLQASFDLLGPHPFCRLDLLLVPRCFASMGLASPSIIFLSESLLSGDQSMSIRLAHEISHSWFGLIIGARDWTEEWLSEGFATYMEESIHAKAKKWSPKQQKAYCDLRSILRYRSLVAELENTEEELQTLRPSGEATVGSESQDGQIHYVKNGLNEDKWFIQVHYIKGYFLLRYLANLVGQSHFDGLIKKYVLRYHCQQVLSQQLFSLFFEAFPHLCDQGITKETIYSDWLDNPGMPKDLNPDEFTHSNWLVDEVNIECKTWVEIERKNRCKKSPRKKMKSFEDQHEKLCADQIQLLLEMILEWEAMSVQTLQQLDSVYGVSHGNAEIRHRWCELLVKHRYRARYSDVKQFLLQDQAMGVYLYGELILSEKPTERRLAEACFKTVSREMDRGCYNTVFEMLYGAKHRS